MNQTQSGSYATSFAQFSAAAKEFTVIPVARRLFVDSLTPLGIFRQLGADMPGAFLLESASSSGDFGRYSFVGLDSFGTLTASNKDIPLWRSTEISVAEVFGAQDVPSRNIDALHALVNRWHAPQSAELPPMTGGLVGHISWEAIAELERMPQPKQREFPVPVQSFTMVRDLVAIDQRFSTVTLITNVLAPDGVTEQMWATAQARLDKLEAGLAKPEATRIDTVDFSAVAQPRLRTQKQDYLDAIAVAKEHIVAGDIFQVVVGQRFELDSPAEPLDVYRVLRSLNPSPFMYIINQIDGEGHKYWIVGSSPEALVRVANGKVVTHPIAGSRPRGATAEEDVALAEGLLQDPKERSEHLMLVDLARNDLSKVCVPGTVQVQEFMYIEKFSHIMHISSNVEGKLAPGMDAVDTFVATFPAGTLSGAPKPKAMEIITNLEPAQRGIYGGVIGYFDFTGAADLAIAIRTAAITNGVAYVQAGAGLVADSDPESEYQESCNKAAAPLRAVTIAAGMKESPHA